MKNSLSFGGVNSADYGVWLTGSGTFSAPERDVEFVAVPGRNGELVVDNGRWRNIEVSYPANIPRDFDQRMTEFRSAMCRQRGYQRLEDTYHPDEYRMGAFVMGIEPETIPLNRGGDFNLVFNCKPQRFLKSGEIPIQLMPWVPLTYRTQYIHLYGDTISFEAHVPQGDQITVKFATYDPSLTEYRSTSYTVEDGDITSISIANPDEDERFWRLEITNGVTDPEQVSLQLKFETDYFNGGGRHINATFGQYFTLKNPTGYAAKPLLEYWGQQIPMTTWDNYTNGEQQFYYDFHSDVAPSAEIFMDCDLQYLYGYDKTNLTSYLYLNTSGSGIGEGLVFPELSEDETKLNMYFLTSDFDKGLGIVNIYPNWWRL